ncbi:MAG: LTA synthase family protein [Bacteroidales bacterium]|nr:LTA synthase family protein [Bacteroidales bacterium]
MRIRESLDSVLRSDAGPIVATVINILMAYVVSFIARVAYFLENYSYFAESLTASGVADILRGSLAFDTSGIIYMNILYMFMMLVPTHLKETVAYHKACRIVYVVFNALALMMNLGDSVYFKYTMRRTTSTVFSEFSGENNLGGIFGIEILRHWYLVLLFAAVVYLMWKAYVSPKTERRNLVWWRFTAVNVVCLAVVVGLSIAGIRGGFTRATRPITISNANQYVSRPIETALVLNTPFSIIRTIGKKVFVTPEYYKSEEEMESVFTPVHVPATDSVMRRKNVVVFIVESFGREYIGALNGTLDNSTYKGYTPFVDSLIEHSATFKWSYCNGRKSIDGMPSILSSIPMFVEPFFLTPASLNKVGGIARSLSDEGYETAFFHGAQRGSMGFQAFSRSTGFGEYYGREDFDADPRYGGEEDFDGNWAIWDEPFLQYYCTKMGEMKEPFMTAVFTASSHHPYVIPEKYKEKYPEEGIIMHKCIRYTDNALRRFFDEAKKQPWYRNTLFVLTSDHTNLSDHQEYQTDLGGFCSPIVFYDPSGELFEPGMREKVAQQIDIMPSVLGLLGYGKPYVAFGCDLFTTAPEDTWAVNYLNGIYQYVRFGHVLQFDGEKTKAVYALTDSLMKENVVGKVAEQGQMEAEVKAIIQQYMGRMNGDKLTANE